MLNELKDFKIKFDILNERKKIKMNDIPLILQEPLKLNGFECSTYGSLTIRYGTLSGFTSALIESISSLTGQEKRDLFEADNHQNENKGTNDCEGIRRLFGA